MNHVFKRTQVRQDRHGNTHSRTFTACEQSTEHGPLLGFWDPNAEGVDCPECLKRCGRIAPEK